VGASIEGTLRANAVFDTLKLAYNQFMNS